MFIVYLFIFIYSGINQNYFANILLGCFFSSQNDFHVGLDLSEARASLLSGDVVELTNATSTEPTSMKLVWEVNRINWKPFISEFVYFIWYLIVPILVIWLFLYLCTMEGHFSNVLYAVVGGEWFFIKIMRLYFRGFLIFDNIQALDIAVKFDLCGFAK